MYGQKYKNNLDKAFMCQCLICVTCDEAAQNIYGLQRNHSSTNFHRGGTLCDDVRFVKGPPRHQYHHENGQPLSAFAQAHTFPTSPVFCAFSPVRTATLSACAKGEPPPHGIVSRRRLAMAMDFVGGRSTSARSPYLRVTVHFQTNVWKIRWREFEGIEVAVQRLLLHVEPWSYLHSVFTHQCSSNHELLWFLDA